MISKLKENRVLRSYLGGERIDRFLGKEGKNCYYPEDWTASVVKALNPGSTKEDEGYGYLENGTKVKDIINGDMRCLVKLLDSSKD